MSTHPFSEASRQQKSVPMKPDPAELIALANARFMALFEAGDGEGFSGLYTEDAILMPPNIRPLVGRTGAMQFFASLKEGGVGRLRLSTHELEHSKDMAWERGTAEALSGAGEIVGRSKYIVIWKRTNDGWCLHRDIMNADPTE